ncbi:LmeA family phospholipid-binding protein [Micromonospora sp. NPDC003197]
MADSYQTYPEQPVRRRRGRRLLITLIVLLIVLAGVLAVADRLAVGVAERAIADQAERELTRQQITSSQPDVSVNGFPFLTQVANGQYESITIKVRDAEGPVQGQSVRLPEINIDARDVHAPLDSLRSGQGTITAKTVVGTGTVSYDTVAQFMGKPGLRLSEQDGKLAVAGPLEILGQERMLRGTADLSIVQGEVAIRFDTLDVEGLTVNPLAEALIKSYARQISVKLPLPAMPFQLDVQEVRPEPEGLAVRATATNVPLNGA